jgi:phage replication O-like protein O
MPFDSPNYTQMPNDLLGDWSKPSLMSEMSECELKVVLAICRLTFGYHRRRVRAALPILIEMTGLSKQGVINGTKAAEKRGLIQRVSQPGRGKIATWEVITTEKVNDLDLFRNGQNNGPFEAEKVNDLDSKGQHNSPSDFGIGETDPLDGVPPATDGHQRAVDGGNGADPVTEVARHLRWLCDGRSMEFPKTEKGQAPYMKAAQDLIARTDAIDDWQILCAAIDDWSENPPEDDKWWRQKSKKPSYPVDHLVTHYGQYKENGSAPPALATPGPLPDFVTS